MGRAEKYIAGKGAMIMFVQRAWARFESESVSVALSFWHYAVPKGQRLGKVKTLPFMPHRNPLKHQ